jgi:hypothetical protein
MQYTVGSAGLGASKMAVYRIRLPETYDCRAGNTADALVKFHTRLTDLLNSGYDLDAEVTEVLEGVDLDFGEPDLFAD